MKEKICLDLGCGDKRVSFVGHKVVTVDSRPEVNAHLICDLHKLPLEDQSVDAIYSSHVLEHFSFRETDDIIKEWLRVLKREGDVVIIVPNIKFACEMILLDDVSFDPLSIMYGGQDYPLNFHKTCFTVKTLHELMMKHGCQGIAKVINDGRECQFEGIRYYL